jgi:hypothetical protein
METVLMTPPVQRGCNNTPQTQELKDEMQMLGDFNHTAKNRLDPSTNDDVVTGDVMDDDGALPSTQDDYHVAMATVTAAAAASAVDDDLLADTKGNVLPDTCL